MTFKYKPEEGGYVTVSGEIADGDGKPYFLAVTVPDEPEQRRMAEAYLRQEETYFRRKAARVPCLLREVPQLGSPEQGPFHPSFRVTRSACGKITGINRVPIDVQ